jgi:TonB family protein
VGAKKTDISQIRKYLNGELDARAMHQLERDAQADPFLMDAIAGYEEAPGLQQRQLNDLESRLQQRISQSKTRKIIPWKYYAAAAAVLMVFSLGYLLWPGRQAPENKQMALKTEDKPVPKPDTITGPIPDELPIAAVVPPAVRKARRPEFKAAAPVTNSDVTVVAEDNRGFLNSKAVIEEPFARKAAVNQNVELNVLMKDKKVDTSLLAASGYWKRTKDSTYLKEITIPGRDALAKNGTKNKYYGYNAQTLQAKVNGAQVTTPKKVSGTVLSDLGLPLPGANIIVDGTQKATQTDAQGRFSIAADGQAMLDIRSIGYQTKRIKANTDDSLKIALNPDTKALAEVVTVGYGTSKTAKVIKEAHPQTGWDNYDKYLKRAATTTDGKAGTVRLSFTVDAKGALSDFRISKGVNETLNNKAIELVKNGPAWAPDISGKPKTVKLKIAFTKE